MKTAKLKCEVGVVHGRRGCSSATGASRHVASAIVFGLLLLGVGLKADAVELAGKKYTYKTSGGKPRGIEVFSPANHDPAAKKAPGIILFHGGNWTDGTPAEFHDACRYFASRGLVAPYFT